MDVGIEASPSLAPPSGDEAGRPSSPEDCARWADQIRSGLRSRPRPDRPRPPSRARAACNLCGAPSSFFVRRDVHLCGGCVDRLAEGRAS